MIGDAQFRVMCNMWGVDAAVQAAKRMGMTASKGQIETAKEKEREANERWNAEFKPKEE